MFPGRSIVTNADRIRAAYTRWIETGGKDTSCWYQLFHEDIEFDSMGLDLLQTAPGRELSKRQMLRAFMEYLQQDLDMLEYSVSRCVEKDNIVVSIGDSAWRVRSTGRIFRTKMVKMFWFKDGLIIRFEEFFDTAAEREAHGRKSPQISSMPLRPVAIDRG